MPYSSDIMFIFLIFSGVRTQNSQKVERPSHLIFHKRMSLNLLDIVAAGYNTHFHKHISIMKKNAVHRVFIILLALICNNLNQGIAQNISILPKPNSVRDLAFVISIEGSAPVYISKKSGLDKDYVTVVLSEVGIRPKYVKNERKAVIIFKNDQLERKIQQGGYSLFAGKQNIENKIVISARTREGFLHGLQTLRQITTKSDNGCAVKACMVDDAPAFPWRAFMLDESRHFHGMETVKKILDEVARLKMNVFHWHLVDDPGWRIEIKKYPLLTKLGSKRDNSNAHLTPAKWDSLNPNRKMFYTQQELKEVVRYANDRGITVIPEIEVPGHASASIFAYPWLGSSSTQLNPVYGDLYNITDPKVRQFIYDVLDEVLTIFPSRIIHIGGDEANYSHWENSKQIISFMKENNIPTCSDLQVWGINQISRYLASKGARMIGWNEITGDNIREEAHIKASTSEKLAPGTIVQFWDGSVTLVNKAIEKGYDVVNSNRHFTYLDYSYSTIPLTKAYSFNPIPDGLTREDQSKILGLGCQMWGEFTPNTDRLYFQIFPRLAAYAECGWTPAQKKDYNDFRNRLKPIEAIWGKKGYLKNQPADDQAN